MPRALSLLPLKRNLLQLSLRKTGKRIDIDRKGVASPMKDLAELIQVKHDQAFFLPLFFMNF